MSTPRRYNVSIHWGHSVEEARGGSSAKLWAKGSRWMFQAFQKINSPRTAFTMILRTSNPRYSSVSRSDRMNVVVHDETVNRRVDHGGKGLIYLPAWKKARQDGALTTDMVWEVE